MKEEDVDIDDDDVDDVDVYRLVVGLVLARWEKSNLLGSETGAWTWQLVLLFVAVVGSGDDRGSGSVCNLTNVTIRTFFFCGACRLGTCFALRQGSQQKWNLGRMITIRLIYLTYVRMHVCS